ncbi:MAG: hypothetical protein C0483_11695 [Pirellula sp.]|nr:hypothetical protein [Pirellula sp.]
MSKQQDLELVFAAIPTSGLKSLWKALRADRVIRGRFIDGHGKGCLFHWLSERQMIDRPSRVAWTSQNLLFGNAHDAAMRRVIVGWDAADPDAIVKGAGYESEYPTASYVVRAVDVRRAIRKVMRVRRSANQAEGLYRLTAVTGA